jgi:hypothetical protein
MARLQNKKLAAVTTDLMGWRMVKVGFGFQTIQPRRTKMIKLDRTDTPAVAERAAVYLAFEQMRSFRVKWQTDAKRCPASGRILRR